MTANLVPSPPATGRKRVVMLAVLLALTLAAFVAVFGTSAPIWTRTAASSVQQASANATSCDRDAAQGQLLLATADGVVKDFDREPDGAVLYIRVTKWDDLSVSAQKRVLSALDCALAGPGNHLATVHVRDRLAGDDIATLDAVALYGLREQGFSKVSPPQAAALR